VKKLLSLTIPFLFLWVSNSVAEPLPKHIWEFGTEISHIKYEEPGIMEDKGMMYGLSGSYTFHDGIMFNGEARLSFGQVDYESSETGSIDNIDDYIFEIRGVLGYDFTVAETSSRTSILSPYIGFGYRYLNDDSSGMTSTTGARGYERESNYYYSPLGLWINTIYEKWSFGLMIEYDIFWYGLQKSHLSDAVAGINDVENDQDEGYGLRGSFKIVRKFMKRSLVIEPFVRYWNIEKSDVSPVTTTSGYIIGRGWEPDNESTEVGIKIAIRF